MGSIVIDAGVLVGFLNPEDAHQETARAAIESAKAAGDVLALPASALAESLVWPMRSGEDAVGHVYALLEMLSIDVIPLDIPIAEAAARLRARLPSLRLPDALVIATAQVIDADRLVTTDQRWPDTADLGVPVEVLRT